MILSSHPLVAEVFVSSGIELLEPFSSFTLNPMTRLYVSRARGPDTALRDAQVRLKQQQRWKQVRIGGQDPSGFPSWPVKSIYDSITTKVSDDLETQYEGAGGQVGAEGTEREALRYTTNPPPDARTLRVAFSVDGVPIGRTCKIARG